MKLLLNCCSVLLAVALGGVACDHEPSGGDGVGSPGGEPHREIVPCTSESEYSRQRDVMVDGLAANIGDQRVYGRDAQSTAS